MEYDNWNIIILNNSLFFSQDSNVETVILISPKFGLSQINSLRNSVVSTVYIFCTSLIFQ